MFALDQACTADLATCIKTKEIIAAFIGAAAALIAGGMAVFAVYIPERKKKPQNTAIHLEAISKALIDMANEFGRSGVPTVAGGRLEGNIAGYEKELNKLMGEDFSEKLKTLRDAAIIIDNGRVFVRQLPGIPHEWIHTAEQCAGDLQAKADLVRDS